MQDVTDGSANEGSPSGTAAEEIDRIRTEARSDPNHPYNDASHPEHKTVHRQVLDLYRQSDGSQVGSVASDGQQPHATVASSSQLGNSVEEAQAEIDRIYQEARNDPGHPYNNRRHPKHAEIHQRMLELQRVVAEDDAEQEGEHHAGSDEDFDAALRSARVRNTEISTEELSQEFELIRGWFGDAGLSADEAGEVIKAFNEIAHVPDETLHDPERTEQAAASSMRALEAIWGDQLEANVDTARRAVRHLDKDGTILAYLEETRLGDDPRIIRILADVGHRNGW